MGAFFAPTFRLKTVGAKNAPTLQRRKPLSERKPFLLRIDAQILEAVQRWANDDLRSINAQIEFLLRKALKDSRRAKVVSDGKTGQPKS